ncbi:MAG: complement resistance protein TraT [Psychrobium sp.]
MKSRCFVSCTILGLSLLTGCVNTANKIITKSELRTSTQMSQTIWLDPTQSNDYHTIFLQVGNTTDQVIQLKQSLASKLANLGYRIESEPNSAQVWLQINVLKVGRSNLDETRGAVSSGFGGAIIGGVIANKVTGGDNLLTIAGSALGAVSDSIWQDVIFAMITDVKITLPQDGHKTHHTRVVSSANQINLEFLHAKPALEQALVNSLAGILAK